MNITLNRIPKEVNLAIRKMSKNRSGYLRQALAEKLTRDGRPDLAALLTK